jgi:hypothetical protein
VIQWFMNRWEFGQEPRLKQESSAAKPQLVPLVGRLRGA